MMITREQIEERRSVLVSEREKVRSQLIQLQANVNAFDGAIEDCDFWLTQINQPQEVSSVDRTDQ